MNKIQKKVLFRLLRFSLVILFLLIVTILVKRELLLLFSHSNHNEVIYEILSPDGKYKAVVFNRNFGATTAFNYQLSILKKDEKLKDKEGNVFISYSRISVGWKDDKTLLVTLSESKHIFKQIHDFYGISILYSTDSIK